MEKNREQFNFLHTFLSSSNTLFADPEFNAQTQISEISIEGERIPRFINEFWTSKQRRASSIHEISYRACFKPQLPRFFISLFTLKGDLVYDPFSGRGTTVIEAALLGRSIISNDVNPLSEILTAPRFFIPSPHELEDRLSNIPRSPQNWPDIDLSMFYHSQTFEEIIALREYLINRQRERCEDHIDRWIRMVATNRLTGHSKGFFSVYTLPPNQAVSPGRQMKINQQRKQKPEYRDTHQLILRKSHSLWRNLTSPQVATLNAQGKTALFLNNDARSTPEIASDSVALTVTSPPFLDVVQYADDNWLRCWFNHIDVDRISRKITMSRSLKKWSEFMQDVFRELFRITRPGGWVAFEVGEVRKKSINLDEVVVPLGKKAGFSCEGIVINLQKFTKTAKIWGVDNNNAGTNTNRVVLFKK
ncbi:MAG: DNA methylase [Calditrichia bacterium]